MTSDRRHIKLRLSEIPLYIGPIAVLAPGTVGPFNPTPQECDCIITPTRLELLYDLELCDKHVDFGPTI